MQYVGEEPLPGDDAEREDDYPGQPVAGALLDPSPGGPPRQGVADRRHSTPSTTVSTTSSAPTAWSRSRTSVTSSKKRGSSRVSAPLG